MDNGAQQIIRLLERNASSGQRPSQIYHDWLQMVDTTLRMLPAHAESVAEAGRLADDDEEGKRLWTRLRETYRDPAHFKRFANAYHVLLHTSESPGGEPDYKDTVGSIFMEFGNPSPGNGQFFTSFSIARMMAELTTTVEELTSLILERIREAVEPDPVLRLWLETESMVTMAMGGDMHSWLVESVLPRCADRFKPVGVYDCAVGSGVMLLAKASTLPRWMVQTGVVQFYGQDIDATCALMANINLKLYGLNGWGLKYRIAGLRMLSCLSTNQAPEAAQMPEPDFVLPEPGKQIGMFTAAAM